MLSITTDYMADTGDPRPYLKRIADAGFSHVHWCHEWDTDHFYPICEIDQIRQWLRDYGLQLLDLHASAGKQKAWGSSLEHERMAGVDLMRNRIDMTAMLSGDVIIAHLPSLPQTPDGMPAYWNTVHRSLDVLEPHSRARGVRIAVENGHFETIAQVLAHYGPDYIGLCYDSGHGNLRPDGLNWLERLKDRLISIHLHDNDGTEDQHGMLFTGTVDWPRLADIMARSSYDKCVSMELSGRRMGVTDEPAFLAQAFAAGTRFAKMIEKRRKA